MDAYRLGLLSNQPDTTDIKVESVIEYATINEVKCAFNALYKGVEEGHDSGRHIINSMTKHSLTYTDKATGIQYYIYFNHTYQPSRERFLIKNRNIDYLNNLRRKIREGRKMSVARQRRFGIAV